MPKPKEPDMQPSSEAITSAIHKAEVSTSFTKEEVEALKAVADAWRGLEAFGRVAKVVRTILIYVGWLIAVWMAVRYAIADYVKGLPR